MKAVDALDAIIAQYNKLLNMCYKALAASTPQEERDNLRKAIEATKQE
jgi:hypothetical protein